MKLKREKVKPKFWEFVMFEPKAFKVLFFMSIIMGLLISISLVTMAFVYKWDMEYTIIVSMFAIFNVYNAFKYVKIIKNVDNVSINEMVYKDRYKPKEVKHGNNRR